MQCASRAGAGSGWAAGQTAHAFTLSLDFSSNPNSTLNPQVGPPFVIPANCPFDNNAVFTITGNTNQHQTGNNNGFWAGGTITGSATLSEGTGPALYTGQATGWFGFGTNQSATDTTGQAEEGETFHFHGTNSSGQSLDVSLDYHGTMNNNGTITNFHEDISCRGSQTVRFIDRRGATKRRLAETSLVASTPPAGDTRT